MVRKWAKSSSPQPQPSQGFWTIKCSTFAHKTRRLPHQAAAGLVLAVVVFAAFDIAKGRDDEAEASEFGAALAAQERAAQREVDLGNAVAAAYRAGLAAAADSGCLPAPGLALARAAGARP